MQCQLNRRRCRENVDDFFPRDSLRPRRPPDDPTKLSLSLGPSKSLFILDIPHLYHALQHTRTRNIHRTLRVQRHLSVNRVLDSNVLFRLREFASAGVVCGCGLHQVGDKPYSGRPC